MLSHCCAVFPSILHQSSEVHSNQEQLPFSTPLSCLSCQALRLARCLIVERHTSTGPRDLVGNERFRRYYIQIPFHGLLGRIESREAAAPCRSPYLLTLRSSHENPQCPRWASAKLYREDRRAFPSLRVTLKVKVRPTDFPLNLEEGFHSLPFSCLEPLPKGLLL